MTEEQAAKIIAARPFERPEDINVKLGQTKKKSGATGISPRIFEDTVDIMAGYADVDRILEECETIGAKLKSAIAAWTSSGSHKGKGVVSREGSTVFADDLEDDGALSLRSHASFNEAEKNQFLSQPLLLSDSVTLKEYQLLGVNWLHLLYNRKLSCILADEMGKATSSIFGFEICLRCCLGLGKTVQVISFFALLKERGINGPHLVVVP